MRCIDVIEFIVIKRRHIGGILLVTKNSVKCRKSEILRPMLFADRVFRLAYISTYNS